MQTILQTSRFILKEFSAEDSEGFYRMNLDPEVLKYTGDKPFNSIKEAEDFINNYDHYEKFGFGRWTIIEKTTGNYIGWCGLKYTLELNEVDIGFRIAKNYWGNGIAAETAKAVLLFGFNVLKMENIIARVMKNNTASIRVIEKLRMKFRNSFKDELGEWLVYEISPNLLM